MRRADHIIDLGPRRRACTAAKSLCKGRCARSKRTRDSETGRCLQNPLCHPTRKARRSLGEVEQWIEIRGAHANNLKNVDVRFPVGPAFGHHRHFRLREIDADALGLASGGAGALEKENAASSGESVLDAITGAESFETVYEVDQSPIGKTSRSTPATYIKVFDEIRNLYAQLPVSRVRGIHASRFSFNAEGGRCETCSGQGVIKLEMSFLPSSYVPCEDCGGRRYNPQTLEVLYNEKSIGDVMEMTIEQAAEFFATNQKIARPLSLLVDTGLGISEAGPAEPDLERRRSATAQARDGADPRNRARAERADSQNAQTEIDALSPRGADDRTAHGGRDLRCYS